MEQPNDLLKARIEAALLLRLDPSNLSPSDTLRCDLIASLRLVVDDASTSVLDGRAPDLAKLLTATESLIKLLPSDPPQPANKQADPRAAMWAVYSEMRRRGALVGEGLDGAKLRIERLTAELANKDARIAELEATLAGSVPLPPNVVPMRHATSEPSARAAATPQPPKPAEDLIDLRAGYSTGPAEPWRDFCGSGPGYDRWSDRRE